ncbi:hypothetical protein IWW37_004829 [Coemansia sp. RSA 2050]|nr:hypothetical protein IWW37_004829 [Coemansia sp. RSA 2050]
MHVSKGNKHRGANNSSVRSTRGPPPVTEQFPELHEDATEPPPYHSQATGSAPPVFTIGGSEEHEDMGQPVAPRVLGTDRYYHPASFPGYTAVQLIQGGERQGLLPRARRQQRRQGDQRFAYDSQFVIESGATLTDVHLVGDLGVRAVIEASVGRHVGVEHIDGVLRIRGNSPDSWWWWWQESGCVRATLYVGKPRNSTELKSLDITTTAGSGTLTALDVGAYPVDRVKVAMRNGRVQLHDLSVRGSLHLSMSNGLINATNVRVGGSLELSAPNSPIDLVNITAANTVSVQASNAHINAISLRSSYAHLRTSNGRVSLGGVDVGDNLLVHTINATSDVLGTDCLLRDIQASKGYANLAENTLSTVQSQRRYAEKEDKATGDKDDDSDSDGDAEYATGITTIVFSPTISHISGAQQPTVTVSAFVPIVPQQQQQQGFANALSSLLTAPSGGRPLLPFVPMPPANPTVLSFVPMVPSTPTVVGQEGSAAPTVGVVQGLSAVPNMPMGGVGTYFPVQNVNLIVQSSLAPTGSVSPPQTSSGCWHCCDCGASSSTTTMAAHCCGGGGGSQPPADSGPGDCCRWLHDYDSSCCGAHTLPLAGNQNVPPPAGLATGALPRRPEQQLASSSSGKPWQAPQAARPTPDWVPSANDINEYTKHGPRVVSNQALPTLHNRPEVGESSTVQATPAPAPTAAESASENFRIHNGGQDVGFAESVDEWERLLVATKTVGLPELLDKPHTPPALGPLPTETNSMHFDPSSPLAVDSYQAPEYNPLATGDRPDKIAEDVWRLVESLSLEEKVGQMQQIHVSQLLDRSGRPNATAVEHWVSRKMVGSVVDSPGNGLGAYAWYSAATLASLTSAVQQVALAQGSRVPLLWGLDSVRGASFVKHAAMFPAGIGIAATFQPKHAYEAGRIAARDTRAAGYQWAFAPSADLNVEKRWAHGYLGFGEDPALLASMVRSSVGGYQGEYRGDRARVAACVKSFVGSSIPFNGRERGAKFIPDSVLHEYYLPGFEAAIAAGATSVMQSGGNVNGEAMSLSAYYLRSLLRDKLGFRGVVVSDHGEILAQARELHTAANFTDAVFLALNNTSVDVSAGDAAFSATAVELVNAGSIGEDRITESVARIIQLKKDLGLFDSPFADRQLQETVGSAQDVGAARMAVSESLTLLKNDNGALPLKPGDRVLFVGPHLNSTALLGGGWNVHRQGPTASERDDVYEGFGDSVLSGIRKLTNREPVYHPGFRLDGRPSDAASITNLLRLARQADKIVVGLGEAPYAGHMGDINDLSLDPNQAHVVEQLAQVNRPIIAVLIEGRPRLLKDVATVSSAVLNAYLPGIHGGLPIAEVLYGKVSPSGRQPFTYPRYEYQSRDTIWQGLYNEYTPQWPFGYGLGYSPLVYSNITIDRNELRPGQPVKISVSIRNDGLLDQKESVLLYTTQAFRTGYEPELYRLRGFDKVEIAKGMATVVEFTLTAEELAYYNRDLVRVIDPSPVNITINAMTPNERVITLNLAL